MPQLSFWLSPSDAKEQILNCTLPIGCAADWPCRQAKCTHVKSTRVGVGASHHDIAQTQHVHAHRPHLLWAADDGDEGEAQRVGATVFGQLEPISPAMSQ